MDHCLHFKDNRFRKDPAFMFVCSKVVQVRVSDRVMETRILFKKLCKGSFGRAPPMATVKDFDYALFLFLIRLGQGHQIRTINAGRGRGRVAPEATGVMAQGVSA